MRKKGDEGTIDIRMCILYRSIIRSWLYAALRSQEARVRRIPTYVQPENTPALNSHSASCVFFYFIPDIVDDD
jgi:hypothetical protein